MYEPKTRTIESFQQLGGVLSSKIWIDKEGFVAPSEEPGLGAMLNEEMIARYSA